MMKPTTQNTDLRKVRFSDQPEVKEVQVVDTTEREALWYTSRDLDEIRKQQQDETCAMSPVGSDSLNQNKRRKFVRNLLEQQTEHKEMGLADPKGLFQLSRASSKKSRQEALQIARAQEEEVKQLISCPEKPKFVSCLQKALFILDEL